MIKVLSGIVVGAIAAMLIVLAAFAHPDQTKKSVDLFLIGAVISCFTVIAVCYAIQFVWD